MSEPTPAPDAFAALLQSLYGPPAVEEILRRDREFAQSLAHQGLVPGVVLESCLEEQERSARAGTKPVPRLRKLLIQKKILTPTQVAEAAEFAEPGPPERLGPYLCVEKLGSGGMGEVWKAWDTDLGRPVALKLLKADDPDELARFRREAELSAKLAHPNIAAIYGFGSEDGRPYIAMQFVEGRTLDHVPRTDRKLLVRIVRDAARAVGFAHQQGIVHRDLKPTNLMVGNGQVFVLDFGLARRIEGGEKVTAAGFVLGTPAYMSPEQARGGDADLRSDVYGLGATLYELLTGRPPFQGRHLFDVLKRVEEENPRLERTVGRELQAIVLKCLEKDPARRYSDAGALADDLDRYLESEPVFARVPSVMYRLRKKLAKRKALAAAATAVILLGGATAVLVRRASSAEASAVAGLRRQTQTALLAVLEVRRSGRTENLKPFVGRTQEACWEAMTLRPRTAEPHYRLGRMYRAVMDDTRALEEQNLALEKEPGYGPALYERGVLLSRQYRLRVEDLFRAAMAAEGKRLAAGGEVAPGSEVRRPDWRKLAEQDGRAKSLMERMIGDLRKLGVVAGDLTEGERTCARGLMAWAEWKEEEAVKLLTAALAADPGLEEATEALARQHAERGRFEEAIQVWSAGHERDRGYVPHLLGRGHARMNWGNIKHFRGEDPTDAYREAIEDFGEVLKRDPDSGQARRWRGGARLNLASYVESRGGDAAELYDAGIEDLNDVLKRNSESAEAWSGRGLARLSRANHASRRGADPSTWYAEANEDLGESLKRDPDSDEAWLGRGFVRFNWAMYKCRRGEDPASLFREAIEDVGEALKRNPERGEAWERRGHARSSWGAWRMGRGEDPGPIFRDAIEDFGEAIRRSPTLADPWTGRGGVRVNWAVYKFNRGEDPVELFREAIGDYAEALGRNSELVLAWRWRGIARMNWGICLDRRGEDPTELFRGSIDDHGEAVKRSPTSSESWEALGSAQLTLGIYQAGRAEKPEAPFDDALRSFARAIEINGNEARSWHARGNAYRRRAAYKAARKEDGGPDWRAALECYQTAIRLNKLLEPNVRPLMEECRRRLDGPTVY